MGVRRRADADREKTAVADERAVSERMELIPLSIEDEEIRLRVELLDPPAADEEPEDGLAIDTPSPNRY